MANTFLKRKFTARRVWELYCSKIPMWGHLFLALTGFSLILAHPSVWTADYYHSLPHSGPLFSMLSGHVLSIPPVFFSGMVALGVTSTAILLSFAGIAAPVAAFWAFAVMCGTLVFPLSKSLPLEGIVSCLWAILSIIAMKLRFKSDIRLYAIFALLLITSALLYVPSMLVIPLFANFSLGKKIPDVRKRVFYSVVIGVTAFVALGGVSLIGKIHFWDTIAMLDIKAFPVALWTVFCSPGRSMLLYSLPLFIALLGYRHMLDEQPDFARFYTGVVVVAVTGILLLDSNFYRLSWTGEPLTAVLPFLMIPAAWLNLRRNLTVWFAALVLGLGIICQTVYYIPDYRTASSQVSLEDVYIPSQSPLFASFQ